MPEKTELEIPKVDRALGVFSSCELYKLSLLTCFLKI